MNNYCEAIMFYNFDIIYNLIFKNWFKEFLKVYEFVYRSVT